MAAMTDDSTRELFLKAIFVITVSINSHVCRLKELVAEKGKNGNVDPNVLVL